MIGSGISSAGTYNMDDAATIRARNRADQQQAYENQRMQRRFNGPSWYLDPVGYGFNRVADYIRDEL